MTTPGRANGWVRIPRARLARAGGGAPDALQWAGRAGAVVLAIAIGWCLYAALRPLPAGTPVDDAALSIPALPATEDESSRVDERRALLARLTRENLFDAGREAWSGIPQVVAEAELAPGGAPPAPAPPGARAESIGGRSISVTGADALPDDVKQALTGLALRGIFVPPGTDEPVAMISRVHAGPNPLASDIFRTGDEFEDKQHPQAKWKVAAIDQPGRRVILQRSNVNAALRLYAAGAAPISAAAEEGGSPVKKGPRIVTRTREDLAADLRAANLTEEQVRRLLELAEMNDDEARAAVALEEMAQSKPPEEEQKKTGRRAPPPGLEAIAKLLQQAPTQPNDPPPTEPAEKPE